MSRKTDKLIDPPTPGEADALSEVLVRVRLQGAAVRRYAPLAPFGVGCGAGTRQLHIIEAGTLTLTAATAAQSAAAQNFPSSMGAGGDP